VKEELGDELEITWRSFALEQVNSKEGDDWKAWEQGPDYESRGLLALCAGEASKSQGNVVTPEPMIDQFGADSVRYWAARARLGVDTAYDETRDKFGHGALGRGSHLGRDMGLSVPMLPD